MFSKYDVNIYLNETELVTLKYGKDYSGSFDAKAGKNTLHFYRDGKKKVTGSLDFDLDEDKEMESCGCIKVSAVHSSCVYSANRNLLMQNLIPQSDIGVL